MGSGRAEDTSDSDGWTPRGLIEMEKRRRGVQRQKQQRVPPSGGEMLRQTSGPDGAATIRAGTPAERQNTPVRRSPRLGGGVIQDPAAQTTVPDEAPPSAGAQVHRSDMESAEAPGWIPRAGQTEKDREENAYRRAHGWQRPDKPGQAPWRGASYRRINRLIWVAECGSLASYKTALWRLKMQKRGSAVIQPGLGCACPVHAKGFRKKRYVRIQRKWKRQLRTGEKVLIYPPDTAGVDWFRADYRTIE